MFTCCTNDSSVINLIYSGKLQFSHNTMMVNEASRVISEGCKNLECPSGDFNYDPRDITYAHI
jgi:hypothetical protein